MKAFVRVGFARDGSIGAVNVAAPPLRPVLLHVRDGMLLLLLLLWQDDARWRSATIGYFVRLGFAVVLENVVAVFAETLDDACVEGHQVLGDALTVNVDAFGENGNLHRDLIFQLLHQNLGGKRVGVWRGKK